MKILQVAAVYGYPQLCLAEDVCSAELFDLEFVVWRMHINYI